MELELKLLAVMALWVVLTSCGRDSGLISADSRDGRYHWFGQDDKGVQNGINLMQRNRIVFSCCRGHLILSQEGDCLYYGRVPGRWFLDGKVKYQVQLAFRILSHDKIWIGLLEDMDPVHSTRHFALFATGFKFLASLLYPAGTSVICKSMGISGFWSCSLSSETM